MGLGLASPALQTPCSCTPHQSLLIVLVCVFEPAVQSASAAFTYKNRLRVAFFIIQITYVLLLHLIDSSLSLRCDLLLLLLLIVEV